MLSGRQVAASRPVANRYTRENNNNKPCVFLKKNFKTDAHAENCHGRADSMQFAFFFVCVDDALIYVVGRAF
jgi:hypothetical protein